MIGASARCGRERGTAAQARAGRPDVGGWGDAPVSRPARGRGALSVKPCSRRRALGRGRVAQAVVGRGGWLRALKAVLARAAWASGGPVTRFRWQWLCRVGQSGYIEAWGISWNIPGARRYFFARSMK